MTNERFSLKARIQSFTHAFRGIAILFKTQHNSWIHLLAIVSVVALGYYVHLDLNEWLFITLSIGLVLVAELANTAIEFLGDKISTEYDEQLKNAKDAAAGAVLVAAIIAVIIAGLIFTPKLILLLNS